MTFTPNTLDAAIIDLDGTMVDTLGDFAQALNLMLADLLPGDVAAARLDAAAIELMVGKGSEHLVKSALKHVQAHMGIAPSAINLVASYEQAYAGYQRHYAGINGRYSNVYPGVVDGLLALQQAGLKLACLTNKPVGFARELLKLKGLDGFFSIVFGGDSFERKKPDPLPLIKTCESLGTVPARTLMIGDSSNDARAARGAGCPVVLVTYGYNHGEPVRGVDSDGFVDSLAALNLQAFK
ncbi:MULTISPECIES: phosphoglycolate phosphatase [unclassified Polaromonas]|uniref:phosphoglycolate phosphatase n=1 Tax=unclassified Polaromonas TaxID=2638319 RepID=UPI000F08095F|nr:MULTISPECIES: phosphoglycolate phosphatase [unclassified Polaromonas]AYQ28062.1 phosphoglycolate phosphatase [Polaromonas sp. SP1]QGJ17074.1 phosphoglycolate phosphatase [Polaromonas sp. Pch-P]